MIGTLMKIFAFAAGKRGLLKRSLFITFLCGLFTMLQFVALYLVLQALVAGERALSTAWLALGVMALSLLGRILTNYRSTMAQTETGYSMVAEKRVEIGDHLRHVPMGYFNDNSIGGLTAVVTTTLGDVENLAARVLISVLGGFFNAVAVILLLLFFDWRIGLIAVVGVLCYLAVTEWAIRRSSAASRQRQQSQGRLVSAVLEYIQGMSIVKAFGLEQDSAQSVGSAIDASCRDNLRMTRASVPDDALKQIVVRVFSVLLLAASIVFTVQGELSLVEGMLLVVASCYYIFAPWFMAAAIGMGHLIA